MDREQIITLADQERFEEVFELPSGAPLEKVRRCFMLMRVRHHDDQDLCAAIDKAWGTLRAETRDGRSERMRRIGHTLTANGKYDSAIPYLRKALSLPGDRIITRKALAACFNARGVEKANRAAKMLEKAPTRTLEEVIKGNWF